MDQKANYSLMRCTEAILQVVSWGRDEHDGNPTPNPKLNLNLTFNSFHHSKTMQINCLDRWVARGKGDAPAIHYESKVGGKSRTLTYAQLLEDVSNLSASLSRMGVSMGKL